MQATREIKRIAGRIAEVKRTWGVRGVARRGVAKSIVYTSYPIHKKLYNGKTFTFQGDRLPYFIAHYNSTWRNERIIEIPISDHFLVSRRGPGLEVGNVLAYYRPGSHTVVDLYENAPGVLNIDVVDYRPTEQLDWIVMISTLEHVGWDEKPRDPDKIQRAVAHLRGLLAPGGRMLVTSPRGYNMYLDTTIVDGTLSPTCETFMARSDKGNLWSEQTREQALAIPPYYKHGRGAQALWVAEFDAGREPK